MFLILKVFLFSIQFKLVSSREMSFPFAATPIIAGPINPLESIFLSFNSNPYFIGIFMVLLNLAGKYLTMGLSPQQELFFQNPYFKPFLFFTVLFIATRNFFAALWLSLALYIIIDHLLNEKSDYYIFGKKPLKIFKEKKAPEAKPPQTTPFTPEESEIYNRLDAKMKKFKETAAPKTQKKEDPSLASYYQSTMQVIGNKHL